MTAIPFISSAPSCSSDTTYDAKLSAIGPWTVVLHNIPKNGQISIRWLRVLTGHNADIGDERKETVYGSVETIEVLLHLLSLSYRNILVATVKLKRLLIDHKVARHLRRTLPVITIGSTVLKGDCISLL